MNKSLEMFEPLKSFFVNQSRVSYNSTEPFCKQILCVLAAFNNPTRRAKTTTKTSAFEAFGKLSLLKTKLASIKTLIFTHNKEGTEQNRR